MNTDMVQEAVDIMQKTLGCPALNLEDLETEDIRIIEQMKEYLQRAKDRGLKVWIDLH